MDGSRWLSVSLLSHALFYSISVALGIAADCVKAKQKNASCMWCMKAYMGWLGLGGCDSGWGGPRIVRIAWDWPFLVDSVLWP